MKNIYGFDVVKIMKIIERLFKPFLFLVFRLNTARPAAIQQKKKKEEAAVTVNC